MTTPTILPTAPATPAFEEVGYVNAQGLNWQQWNQDERVPDLQWPHAVHVYKRMLSEDGRVSSLLQAIGLPIRRTTWRIDPNGAPDEVVEFVARNLGLPVVGAPEVTQAGRIKGRFSWSEHLQTALLMLPYGHSYFEQVYRIDPDGKARLRKLAPRPQATIVRVNVAETGSLISIEQGPALSAASIMLSHLGNREIPVSRLVAYVRDPEPGVWTGSSLLRPAYKHWILKDEFMRLQAATARRNGMGVPVATGAQGASSDDLVKLQKMASQFKGGEYSGVALPYGADLKLQGVNGNLPDMQQAIEYHDKQIALAGLAHFLNLDRGGSYALASVQADTFVQSVQTFAESVCNTANAHIVEDLVDINFGESVTAPRIVFDEIGSRQDLTAQSFKTLIDAGLIRIDGSLEQYTRQQYGLPQPAPGAFDEVPEYTAEELAARIGAAGTLIRSGFDAQDALRAVGLDPIKHLGLLPVTLVGE